MQRAEDGRLARVTGIIRGGVWKEEEDDGTAVVVMMTMMMLGDDCDRRG